MFGLSKKTIITPILSLAVVVTAMFALSGFLSRPVTADNQRAITIHDKGKTITVTTDASTIGEVLQRAKIKLGGRDMVEPAADTSLVAPGYTVNVYRARPVTIVDGAKRMRLMTPYQSPRSIVANADIDIYPEDVATIERIDDFMADDGPGLRVELDRAIPLTLILYGKKAAVRTQADTVGEFMQEKNITLDPKEEVSVPMNTRIKAGMVIDIYRDGVQTKTQEEQVPFETETIQDADREVGYRAVKTAGVKGKKIVTYRVELKNGKEISRKKIRSVVIDQPTKEVVIVGAKPSFSGDFAAALAKLRACEGGYDSWNPAGPYYGAYQFDQQTWGASAPPGAKFGSATPGEQDQAAHNLYMRRGWTPWPVCGANLPDTYR